MIHVRQFDALGLQRMSPEHICKHRVPNIACEKNLNDDRPIAKMHTWYMRPLAPCNGVTCTATFPSGLRAEH